MIYPFLLPLGLEILTRYLLLALVPQCCRLGSLVVLALQHISESFRWVGTKEIRDEGREGKQEGGGRGRRGKEVLGYEMSVPIGSSTSCTSAQKAGPWWREDIREWALRIYSLVLLPGHSAASQCRWNALNRTFFYLFIFLSSSLPPTHPHSILSQQQKRN